MLDIWERRQGGGKNKARELKIESGSGKEIRAGKNQGESGE